MKVSFKWLLAVGVFIVLIAIVTNFISRNFNSSGPARSAFAGRLPGIQDGNKRRFQFFYATKRANNEDSFKGQGSKLGAEIHKGTFDVRISPYLPIEPWVWFNPDYMEWAGRNQLSKDEFSTKLREAVQASPHKSVLVVVWGFRDWFQSAALKTAYTAYVLDLNTPVLLFDWPGNQGGGPGGYNAA
ncbi:MAG: alpha/beta hydrolase, partial [Tatlockia sp.]|nr:alpha/beta hydrolase [Tatlockia sp.]